MKVLTPEKMISLCPLTPAQLQVGEMLMARVMPEFDNAEANLHAQVAEGFIETAGVVNGGKDVHYAIFFHVQAGGILYINGIQRMRKDATMETALKGMDMLAKAKNCTHIAGTARRAGFIRELMRDGYLAFGVTVLKKVS